MGAPIYVTAPGRGDPRLSARKTSTNQVEIFGKTVKWKII